MVRNAIERTYNAPPDLVWEALRATISHFGCWLLVVIDVNVFGTASTSHTLSGGTDRQSPQPTRSMTPEMSMPWVVVTRGERGVWSAVGPDW
jgi:hypothetical protein